MLSLFVNLCKKFYVFGYANYPNVWGSIESSLNEDWLVVLGLLAISAIIGFIAFMSQWQKSAIRTKRQFQMLLVLFVSFLILASIHLVSFQQMDFFSLLLLPTCLLLPFGFRSESLGMAASGAFYMLLAFSVMKFFIFT